MRVIMIKKHSFLGSVCSKITRSLLAMAIIPAAIHAATINVSSSSGLASAVAAANPGDVIVLANGNYSGFKITRSGNAANPITIQAASQNGAVITSGIIQLSSVSWVNIQGLKLT